MKQAVAQGWTKKQVLEECKVNHLLLGDVLGYDFQEDVHGEMFNALALPDKEQLLLLWPRGHFKTSAVVVDIVQAILNDPDLRLLIMQATLKLTKGWLKEIRSHFDGSNPKSRLLQLAPEFKALGKNSEAFTVSARKRVHLKEATVTAASPRAVATGQHYDRMYADDLVNALNFRNVELQDKLESEFYHFLPLIEPGPRRAVKVTGTRYSFADIYARIIKKDTGKAEWFISVRECFKADGSLLFPARKLDDGRTIGFTLELLAQLQRDDPEMFAPQYLNKVVAGKDQIFPDTLLMAATRSTKDPEYPAGAPVLLMVDLAESKTKRADHRVIAALQRDGRGRVWVKECIGSTWSVAQFATVVLQQILLHQPYKVLLDNQPGATFFLEYLRVRASEVGLNPSIEVNKAERQKDAKYIRIASLESHFRSKKLFLCAGIADYPRLEEEFTQFPLGQHDDRPDTIALGVQHLSQGIMPTPQHPFAQKSGSWIVNACAAVVDTEKTPSLCGGGFV